MAAVAVQRIMTLDKPAHVHPFFRKPEHKPPHPPIEENTQDDAAPIAKEVAVVEEKGAGKRKKTSKKASEGTKVNGSKQPSLLAFVGLEKAALPVETAEPAIPNSDSANTGAQEEATPEEDPNYGRRKRRKTVSPGPEPEGQ